MKAHDLLFLYIANQYSWCKLKNVSLQRVANRPPCDLGAFWRIRTVPVEVGKVIRRIRLYSKWQRGAFRTSKPFLRLMFSFSINMEKQLADWSSPQFSFLFNVNFSQHPTIGTVE